MTIIFLFVCSFGVQGNLFKAHGGKCERIVAVCVRTYDLGMKNWKSAEVDGAG